MSVVSMRTAAAWLLALLTLALPPVVRDSDRAVWRPDAPYSYATRDDAKVLLPQASPMGGTKRQRYSGGGSAVLLPHTPNLVVDRWATSTSRLSELTVRLWPRVGHERDPPAT
jgi:hypothetical protein